MLNVNDDKLVSDLAGQARADYVKKAWDAANAPTPGSGGGGGGKGGGASAKALGGLTSGLTLWGEAGPELASVPNRGLMLASAPTLTDFPSGSRVYNSNETTKLLSQPINITQYFTVQGGNPEDIKRVVYQAMDEAAAQAMWQRMAMGR